MYIRTEEKIYTEDFLLGVIRGSTIVKVEDSVEKLIDGYVVVYEKNNTYNELDRNIYNDLELAIKKAKSSNEKYIIYGAIFTKKGVIFATKLNESKGKLELLK